MPDNGPYGAFPVIVADPPWEVMGGPLRGGHGEGFIGTAGSLPLPYPTMTVDEIAALPVGELAADDCSLYLWATNGHIWNAWKVAMAWGFKVSTLCVWCKNPMGGGLGGTFGITTECDLKPGAVAAIRRAMDRDPEVFARKMVEREVELFALHAQLRGAVAALSADVANEYGWRTQARDTLKAMGVEPPTSGGQ